MKRRAPGAGRSMEERSLQILALSRRQDGVTGKDVETAFGVGHRKAAAMLGELATRGHLHRCKVAKLLLHFFASPDGAAAWRARQVPPRKAPKPAPVVTMRSDCKTTVFPGWTHDARFQLAPGERVVGGWGSLGIGRYLPPQEAVSVTP